MYRILIGSPVRQKEKILKEFLLSLYELDKTNCQVDYFFIDDGCEEASSNLLLSFNPRNSEVIVEKSSAIVDSHVSNYYNLHNWDYKIIDRVATLKNYIIDYAVKKDRSNEAELYNYTLMPMHMVNFFSIDELKTTELHDAFSFTKGCKVMKIKYLTLPKKMTLIDDLDWVLYDLENDPHQENPIKDDSIKNEMIKNMVLLMIENEAPIEEYIRLGILEEYNKYKNMH